jgi:hypothetical protein
MAKTDIELGKLTEQISREALKPFPENEPLIARYSSPSA